MGLLPKILKNKFILEILLKSCKQPVSNSKSFVYVYIFLLRPLINSTFIILFWWFQLARCKIWKAPAQVSRIYWLTLMSEQCAWLFPLLVNLGWYIPLSDNNHPKFTLKSVPLIIHIDYIFIKAAVYVPPNLTLYSPTKTVLQNTSGIFPGPCH